MTLAERVFLSYATRQCFICETMGTCGHREQEAEIALIEAELKKQRRPPRVADSPRKARPHLVMEKKRLG